MHAKKITATIKSKAKQFSRNALVAQAIRLGYFSRGVFYSLIGIFAFSLALGIGKGAISQQDIFLSISHIPYGFWVLFIFLIGMAGYSLWGFIRATMDYLFPHHTHIPFVKRIGYIFSGIFYASLLFPILAILFNKPENSAHTDSLKNISAMLLHIPFGQVFLFAIGITSFFSGCMQIRRAMLAKKTSDVNYSKKIKNDHIFLVISRIGIASRGLIWTMVGIFAIIAGVYADPSRIQDTNEVFNTLKFLPFGSFIVMILACGFILFGLYSMSLSVWGKLPNNEEDI